MPARPSPSGILLIASGAGGSQTAAPLAGFMENVHQTFPDCPARWAFTAKEPARIPSVGGEPGLHVEEALSRFVDEEDTGRIVVQPLHVTDGYEQEAVRRLLALWRTKRPSVSLSLGEPLLAGSTALKTVLDAMRRTAAAVCAPGETAFWVGHGSRPPYDGPWQTLAKMGEENSPPVYMGCLLGEKTAEDHFASLRSAGIANVCLLPLFALAGHHVTRDLDGEVPASWKSRAAKAGLTCRVHTRGMLEQDAFADLWLARLRTALEKP